MLNNLVSVEGIRTYCFMKKVKNCCQTSIQLLDQVLEQTLGSNTSLSASHQTLTLPSHSIPTDAVNRRKSIASPAVAAMGILSPRLGLRALALLTLVGLMSVQATSSTSSSTALDANPNPKDDELQKLGSGKCFVFFFDPSSFMKGKILIIFSVAS